MSIKEFIKETEEIDQSLNELSESKTGAEIARELNISRQGVSNTLKRAMKKVFLEFRKLDKEWDAFDTAVALAMGIGDLTEDEIELKKFFKLFPPDIRKQIEADGEKKLPKK